MKISNIEAVYFDLGRVLVYFDHMIACEKFARKTNDPHSAKTVFSLLYGGELEDGFERGMDGARFACEVRRILGAPNFPNSDIIACWGDVFTPVIGIESAVGDLAKAVPFLGIISNTTAPHWEWAKKCIPQLLRLIPRDRRILSFEIGHRKPEREIYLTAIERADCDPSKILFIDDKDENLVGARACGMKTLKFDAREKTANDLRRLLRTEFGINITFKV